MFYQRLHRICKEKGTTVTKMVKEIGLSSANLSNWKNGRLPKTEIAFKIANYLDVSIYDLMGEPNVPKLIHRGKEIDEAIDEIVNKIAFRSENVEETEQKNPLPGVNEERIKELYNMTSDLTDEELIALKAFVAGMKSTRKPD